MPSTVTPVRSSPEQIAMLAKIATAIGDILYSRDILSPTGQVDAIAISAHMAADLAKELADIAGVAA